MHRKTLTKEDVERVETPITFTNWKDVCRYFEWGEVTSGRKETLMKLMEANWVIDRAGHAIILRRRKVEGEVLGVAVVDGVLTKERKLREGKYVKNVCYVLLSELEKYVKGKEDGEVVNVYLSTLEVAELVGLGRRLDPPFVAKLSL